VAVAEAELTEADVEEILKRLTLYACVLYAVLPDQAREVTVGGLGVGPEDLAQDVVLRFLDPYDHTVSWKASAGTATIPRVLGYLKKVLQHDLFDLRKRHAHKTTVSMAAHAQGDGEADGPGPSLDEFPSKTESPDTSVLKRERHEWLLHQFDSEPLLRELLEVQLDPEGWSAHTNVELADLLGTSVSEIENRKKRLMRRLAVLAGEHRTPAGPKEKP
jgi:DNA-directed RNA polymerase specialized sigma24 family protein